MRDLQNAAPSLIPFISAVNENVLKGDYYAAIKEASKLIAKEEELFGNALRGEI